MNARARSKGPRRAVKPAAPGRSGEFDPGLSMVRLVIGAATLGSDELQRRLRTQPREAAAMPPRTAREAEGPLGLGDLAAGLAVDCVYAARRITSSVARRSRAAGSGLSRAQKMPIVRGATRPLLRRYRRLAAEITAVSERGRLEQLKGRTMVESLIRDTTARSVSDIAQLAVREVTHSPEVAALLRTESAGIATDTILDVRANSEQADDRLEGKVQSWLHRGRRDGSHRADPVENLGA
jgi:hypothetical protein